MSRQPLLLSLALLAVTALCACTVSPPEGPSIAALPGKGKTLEQFQNDDMTCRYYASQRNGFVSPQKGAANSAVGTAAIGTALGAATGALIGVAAGNAGMGAAIGAGAGLAGGGLLGSSNARQSSTSLQQNYDMNYGQCMIARGNTFPPQPRMQMAPAYAY
ncbi:putative membrane associated protein [Granulibacter bethesdensis]|uniref:YMGG-like glycine zipper-containing protein n=1 Tax=Granulibacter bethesdensis TaxID=364410 RepID=UPI00090C23BD|nr:glycine zipper domain-containing protein [Granulibacter bethesdensis]APH57853.1 putative membrane associated protein [Granulibacter bethesdensis]